jgi:hypothetical protein
MSARDAIPAGTIAVANLSAIIDGLERRRRNEHLRARCMYVASVAERFIGSGRIRASRSSPRRGVPAAVIDALQASVLQTTVATRGAGVARETSEGRSRHSRAWLARVLLAEMDEWEQRRYYAAALKSDTGAHRCRASPTAVCVRWKRGVAGASWPAREVKHPGGIVPNQYSSFIKRTRMEGTGGFANLQVR